MRAGGTKSREHVTNPLMCSVCHGSGSTRGACMELLCFECDGIGWVETPGQDLTRQLGKALTKARQMARLLKARLPEASGPETHYQADPRDGARGHYTGD